MKKILVVFSVLLLMGFAFDIQANDFSEWAVGDTIGPKGESAQFCAVDHEGKLWITDYGTPGHVGLYVFNSDGSQAPFSPITEGLDKNGSTLTIKDAGGVAYYDSVIYAVSYGNNYILKFKASDGTTLNGWQTALGSPGDIDIDDSGHVFVCKKTAAQFAIYDTAGTELSGSPFGVTGWHLNRGLSVTQDGSRVFLADESSDVIAMYTGSISGNVATYTKGADFMTGLNNPSACEIDPNGRMWISNTGNNELIITELDGTILQTIPDVVTPRGAAFDFDNNLAYVAHFTSATNMAHQLIPAIPIHPEPEELYSWWEKNAGDYTFFQSDDKTRGMDLNPVTGHLLVASRTGGNNIHVLEAENGTYLDSLDMTGVSGGNFPINLVSVASDGVIYGCNLTATGAGFKVYRWGDESSTPTVAFAGDLDQRAGDSFTVVGSGANTIVYASGISAKIYVFTTTDGQSFSLFDEIPILSSLARGGIAPVANTLGSNLWINKSSGNVVLIDTSGTALVTIGDTLNTYFAHVDYLETSDERKLIAVAGGNVADIPRCIRAEIWDVTNPFDPWYYEYGILTNTTVANLNGTGIAILEEKENGVLNLYHLLSNNGIALYCEEELVENTPPTVFHLISPEDNATIRFEDLTAGTLLEVKWSQSFDIDPLDSVAIYEMIVLDESQATVFDTIYTDTLNYSPVPPENGAYTWFVLAKDTRGGVTSSDTFTVTFDIQVPIHPEPEELYTWWEKNAGDYTFFESDDKTRGMDLNPVTGHLLVASRTGGDSVHIIDAGEHIGTLDMTDVSGGTFAINLVSVANDGVIYGSNLTTTGSGFKVYRWENESATPTVAFDGNVDQRVGDSFTAVGSGTGTILYASGANVTKIYVFTTTDGQSFTLFDEIPISASQARGGIAPVADTLGSNLWINKSSGNVVLIDTSGTVLVTIGDTLNTYFAHVDYLETSDERKLIAVAGGNVAGIPRCIRAEIWDVTNPFDPWYYEYGILTNTTVANLNGTGIAILEEKENGVLNLYHLLSNNGIALYCEEELVENTPPTAFHLISPENNATIRFEDLTAGTLLEVKWSQSFDIDLLDSVAIYEMIVLDESQATVFDTIYTDTLNYSPVPPENGTYKWFVLAKDTRGGVTSSDTFRVTFDIQVSIDEVVGIPEKFALYQNYPNPFNPTTFIKYDLPKEAKVKIIIYNLMGEEVRALVNEKQNAGYKSILWDGRDNNGNMVSSGVYIYQMITDEFQKANKMVLLK